MRIPNYEIIGKGKVQLALKDFEDMLDIIAYDQAKMQNSEAVPIELLDRILGGESALRVWREYRSLTQSALAKKVSLTQATVAEIESGRKKGSVATLRALARALDVEIDDIAP